MCPMSSIGPFAVLPSTMLLIISFFILVVVRKLEGQALKTFGIALAVILWACSAMILAKGACDVLSGKYAKSKMMGKCMMHEMREKYQMGEGKGTCPMK